MLQVRLGQVMLGKNLSTFVMEPFALAMEEVSILMLTKKVPFVFLWRIA